MIERKRKDSINQSEMLFSKQKGRHMETEESQNSRGDLLQRTESKQSRYQKSEETEN